LVAPDGERVKLVGFTSWKDGSERRIVFDKPKKILKGFTKSISLESPKERVSPDRITVEGRLLRADSTNPKRGDQLRIVDDKNKRHDIVVKEGGGDIVRTLYESFVRVTGEFDGKQIINAEVEPVA
jgi:hypothetical protein